METENNGWITTDLRHGWDWNAVLSPAEADEQRMWEGRQKLLRMVGVGLSMEQILPRIVSERPFGYSQLKLLLDLALRQRHDPPYVYSLKTALKRDRAALEAQAQRNEKWRQRQRIAPYDRKLVKLVSLIKEAKYNEAATYCDWIKRRLAMDAEASGENEPG